MLITKTIDPNFFKEIISGKFDGYLSTEYFVAFLQRIDHVYPMQQHEYGYQNVNIISHCFNYLQRCLDLSAITPSEENLKKLLEFQSVCSANLKMRLNQATNLQQTDKDNLFASLSFLASLVKHEGIHSMETDPRHNIAFLLEIMKRNTLAFIDQLIAKNIAFGQENLVKLADSLGRLTFELRNPERLLTSYEQDFLNVFLEIFNKTSSKQSTDENRHLAWTFLNQCTGGDSEAIQSQCKELFTLEDCYPHNPLINEIYERIRLGKAQLGDSKFFAEVLEKILQGSSELIASRLQSPAMNNLLAYLKRAVEQQQTMLEPNSLQKFTSLIWQLTDVLDPAKTTLRDNVGQLAPNYYKSVHSCYDLLCSVIKNHLINKAVPFLSYDIDHILTGSTTLLNDLLKNSTTNTDSTKIRAIYSIINSFFNSFDLIAQYNPLSASDLRNLLERITLVSKSITPLNQLESSQLLQRIFGTYGLLIAQLGSNDKIQVLARIKAFYQNATAQLQDDALVKAAVNEFLHKGYPINQTARAIACQELFQRSDCSSLAVKNTTVNAATNTPLPANTTNTTHTTLVPSIFNQTVSEIIDTRSEEISTSLANNSSITNPGNATETEANHKQISPFSSDAELAAAGAHGVVTGTLNGIIQYFAAKYSLHGQQGSTTKMLLIYTSMFAHAAVAATFPLMLLKIQEYINQGDEDEAQKMWDTLLAQALPTFINSVGFSLGLRIVHELSNLLKQPKIRTVAQNTPLIATLWSAVQSPLATGTQICTAITASSLTYGLFNWIAPLNKPNYSDVEANSHTTVEMQSLNGENKFESTNNGAITESKTSTAIISGTPLQYITEEKFNNIKNKAKESLENLIELVNSLKKSIEKDQTNLVSADTTLLQETYQKSIAAKSYVLKKIEENVSPYEQRIEYLNESRHQAAYQVYKIENAANLTPQDKQAKQEYDKAMGELGNVFKLIVPILNTIQQDNLGQAIGYVQGNQQSFDKNMQTTLKEISDSILRLKNYVTIYLSKYNTAEAGAQGEKKGIENAVAQLTRLQSQSDAATLRRTRTNGAANHAYRTCSMYNDRTSSSGSDTSDTSGNNTCNSIDSQTIPLISPTLKV